VHHVPSRGTDGDFNVLTKSRKEFHKASDGKIASAVPHWQGDLMPLHAKNFAHFHLWHTAALEDRTDLQAELSLEQLLFGIGKSKVREDVSAAFGDAGNAAVCFF
jgi:hypothetical protein